MIDNCRKDAYEKIDLKRQTIRQRPVKAPYGDQQETPDGPKTSPTDQKEHPGNEPGLTEITIPRATEFITEISFFRSEKLIEREEDVEAYITNLRSKLMIILEEKNIRV